MGDATPLDAAAFAARFDPFLPGGDPGLWLAAVSGGPDSVALLIGLAGWAAAPGARRPRITAATVDHRLRPESRTEAEAVAALAHDLGLPHRLLVWSRQPGAGPVSLARARRARYDLLVACAADLGAATLVTAHTRDDQAETLLIRAAAGSGLTGLAGMRPLSYKGSLRHLRPLLDTPKAALVATCHAAGRSFAQDPSNRDPAFARPRWRALMPSLAAEGLTAGRLAGLAARLARADDALARTAEGVFGAVRCPGDADTVIRLDFARLADEPVDIVVRVLALAVAGDGATRPDTPRMRLARLEACAAALSAAHEQGRSLRRSLAGRQIALGPDGMLTLAPEATRRRGRRRQAAR